MKEQSLDSCPKDLAIHLRERAPETVSKIAKIADHYLEAHGKHFCSAQRAERQQYSLRGTKPRTHRLIQQLSIALSATPEVIKLPTAQPYQKKCFLRGKQGDKARNCRSDGLRLGGQNMDGNPVQRGQVSASCLVQPSKVKPTEEEVKSCIEDDKLLLASGKKIPLLRSACVGPRCLV